MTVAAKAEEESVGAEFDVVAPCNGVHSNQFDREGINNEFHLNCNCAANDLNNSGLRKLVDEFQE